MADDKKTSRAFRYALLPTPAQEAAIQRQEAQLRTAWNRMVNWQRCTLRDWHRGRQMTLLSEFNNLLHQKKNTGMRMSLKLSTQFVRKRKWYKALPAPEAERRVAAINLRRERLAARLKAADRFEDLLERRMNAGQLAKVCRYGKRRLGVKLAQARLSHKAQHFYGGQKCLFYGLLQKFEKSCENWLKLLGTAQAPRYKHSHDRVALQRQITSSTSHGLPAAVTVYRKSAKRVIADTDLSAMLGHTGKHGQGPGQCGKRIRAVYHRTLPSGAVVKQLAICGRPGRRFLVVFFSCPMMAVLKPFPPSDRVVGIDTGYCMALTATPDTDSHEEYQPPYSRDEAFLRRYGRFQRKFDRQVRANNPHCFDVRGRWIKGKRMMIFSKRMAKTKNKLQTANERIANARRDFYHMTAHSLVTRYGTIALGNWRPMVDVRANQGKDKTKKRRNQHRKTYDHALSMFTGIVEDKANLSATPRTVQHIEEPWTTQTCACCRRLTGPIGVTNIVEWHCESCGALNHRKANNAVNIREKVAA